MSTLLEGLVKFLRETYSPEEKAKSGKDGNVTTFYRKSGKSLCYIDQKDDRAFVTIVIGATLEEKVTSADVSDKTKRMFATAKQFHDGKWLSIELRSELDICDIKTLLAIKKPIKHRL